MSKYFMRIVFVIVIQMFAVTPDAKRLKKVLGFTLKKSRYIKDEVVINANIAEMEKPMAKTKIHCTSIPREYEV